MHPRHKQIIDAIKSGARFVERVHCSSTYYLLWLDGRREDISQDMYFTMREHEYITIKWSEVKKERYGNVKYIYYELTSR